MKSIILILIVFGLYSFVVNRFDQSTGAKITQLRIVYVDATIETIYDIPCDNFDYAFKDTGYKEKKFTNKNLLEKFSSMLKNFQKDNHISSIDTRAKIYITYTDERKSVLCVDPFGYSVMDDQYMGQNKKIISFVKDNCRGFE